MTDIFFELKNQREKRDTQIIQINKNILKHMTVTNKRSKKVSSKFTVYKLLFFRTILAAKTNPTIFDHGNRCF